MGNTADEFLVASDEKAFDMDHRRIINYNIGKYDTAVIRGLDRISNLEHAKRKAHVIKWKVIETLDKALPEFEANFQKRGGKVIGTKRIVDEALEIDIADLLRRGLGALAQG